MIYNTLLVSGEQHNDICTYYKMIATVFNIYLLFSLKHEHFLCVSVEAGVRIPGEKATLYVVEGKSTSFY